MKLCKDCLHYEQGFEGEPQTARCNSPQRISRVNPVDGQPKYAVTMCEVARDFSEHCGPSGRWFESRDQERARS